MIRTAAREEIRKVGRPLWLLINQSGWPARPGEFDITRNGAASIVAHLAYCAIDADEREQRNRAKVVPCRVFQELVVSEDVDFIEVMASLDFANSTVVRTRRFVAVLIPARTFLLIGIRGTQFAYDWIINANIHQAKDENGRLFHSGFLREAEQLAQIIRSSLFTRYASKSAIYLAGHSLGGAVAAILYQMNFPIPINECYMFGAPRISGARNVLGLHQPFATRRDLDIVPHCPPSLFNYSDFNDQKTAGGSEYRSSSGLEFYFFASWLFALTVNQFPKNHSMERYRLEVLETAKNDPRNKDYWERGGFVDIPADLTTAP